MDSATTSCMSLSRSQKSGREKLPMRSHFYLVANKGRGSVNRSPQGEIRGGFFFSALVSATFAHTPGAHTDGASRNRESALASAVAAADSFWPLSASAGEREAESD